MIIKNLLGKTLRIKHSVEGQDDDVYVDYPPENRKVKIEIAEGGGVHQLSLVVPLGDGDVGEIPVQLSKVGLVHGLPGEKPGVALIVEKEVVEQERFRVDLFSPDKVVCITDEMIVCDGLLKI